MARPDGSRNVFLDVSGSISSGGERGLLSMAFAPDYATSGLFFVYYTGTDGDIMIDKRRRADSDHADTAFVHRVLRIEHSSRTNHNGGLLQFGPDGFLYAGTGDGGGSGDPSNNAQTRASLLGKLLRIAPAPATATDTACPPTTRSWVSRAPRRGRGACVTRGVTPSIPPPVTSSSPTSARAPGRRSISLRLPVAAGAASTGAGTAVRGCTTTPRRASHVRPWARSIRCWSCRIATGSARSPGAWSSAIRDWRRSWAATSTETCARAGCGPRGSDSHWVPRTAKSRSMSRASCRSAPTIATACMSSRGPARCRGCRRGARRRARPRVAVGRSRPARRSRRLSARTRGRRWRH